MTTIKNKTSHGHRLAVALALAMPLGSTAWEDTCKPFHKIYADGQELCETIFGDAFVYETDEAKAYTMWWFDAGNPNDATSTTLGNASLLPNGATTTPGTCDLEYYHKSGAPTAEDANFTECHPWQESACCHEATVTTPTAMNEGYGAGYEWDRCGKMSQACERFFVQEACLYECDVNAGLYRKCSDAQVAAAASDDTDPCHYNTWEMYQMPIKASYCDAWYDACYEDKFCGTGNFFACSAYYSESQVTAAPNTAPPSAAPKTVAGAATTTTTTVTDTEKVDAKNVAELPVWAQASIGVLACGLAACAGVFFFTVHKERSGDPLFAALNPAHDENSVDKDVEFRNKGITMSNL